ncbi:hypothetical protein SPRG_08433 [Saprolegnia parasitica CBS 223.65]|uniref:RRM domain-containing protein n=1 Tax=Saprolegnia parasitica (strain CBS 223.65) TaxID=695850 RepID=A0A067C6F5_SAPPC|nr:hypothetical protein SPRG_08433 [Saprolegnia parasitica CBS 223.65]KDO26359.1 hypothetical protein SPRG_08433 [Saprolegnia parasitica CBS 223.65]|eukprot:XP_012203057.1 hypothetical protein SPRG_08433 [Saprolegnia parasitica CBS 223.65]
MVQEADLVDDGEYSDLKEDIEEECSKFGKVTTLVIPRPSDGLPGVGKAFVRFETVDAAIAATKALTGRKFGGNVVDVSYMSVEAFEAQAFA